MSVNIDEVHAEVSVESTGAGAQRGESARRVLPTPRDLERWRQAARTQALEQERTCALDRDD